MTVDTIITNGTIVGPDQTTEAAVAIDGERVVAVGDEEVLPQARTRIDASGKLVMPGVVDPHVHIQGSGSHWAGTYRSETAAAARGGVTTVIDFAWQDGDRNFSEASFRDSVRPKTVIEKKKQHAENTYIDYAFHYVLTKEKEETLSQIDEALKIGVSSFKLFFAEFPTAISSGFADRILRRIADLGGVALFHTEDGSICGERTARFAAENRRDPSWFPESRPDYAEAIAADQALRLAMEAGAKYYGVHTSSAKTADVIERFRDDGSRVRGETCPHYLTLDDSIFERQGNLPVIAPPIRTETDSDALFRKLESGLLDVIATDHIQYHRSSKMDNDWWDCPYGANSIELSLPVFYDEAINRRGYSCPFLVRVMCTNPARLFGLETKGRIEPGYDADIVIFDPQKRETVTVESHTSDNAEFTIYDGRELLGAVETTLVRGQLVVDDGQICSQPGVGRFIERETPTWKD